jgi:predicted Zn-dependent protease
MAWTDDHEQEFGAFRRQYLKKDASGDVAAVRAAAARALAMLPPGPDRVRPLWFLCLACSIEGQWNEAIGALVEISRYKPQQPWVWQLLAQAYQSCGDQGRQDLAEEQAWRTRTDRPMSAYITAVIRQTPYARPVRSRS